MTHEPKKIQEKLLGFNQISEKTDKFMGQGIIVIIGYRILTGVSANLFTKFTIAYASDNCFIELFRSISYKNVLFIFMNNSFNPHGCRDYCFS